MGFGQVCQASTTANSLFLKQEQRIITQFCCSARYFAMSAKCRLKTETSSGFRRHLTSDHNFFLLFRFLGDIVAAQTEHQQERAGNQYGRVDAEHDTDGQCHRKAVQGCTAEHQHRNNHRLGRTVGNDGAAHRCGNRVVNDFRHGMSAHRKLAEIFTDTVEDDDGFVHRIAQYGKDTCQDGQRKFY